MSTPLRPPLATTALCACGKPYPTKGRRKVCTSCQVKAAHKARKAAPRNSIQARLDRIEGLLAQLVRIGVPVLPQSDQFIALEYAALRLRSAAAKQEKAA